MGRRVSQAGMTGGLERILILALAYFVAGYAGLQFPYFGSTVTLIWPPSGIALAALLCWGIRVWPGVALGAFAVNMTTGVPLETVMLITIGNSLSAIAGAWLVGRLAPERHLGSLRGQVIFLIFGVLASPLVSSLNGAAVISITLAGNWDGFATIWWGWWIGDLMGILLFCPLLLQLDLDGWKERRGAWYAELLFLALGAAAISVLVHQSDILARQEFLFIFVSLPFALWGALRFGILGAALVNLAVSITAILFLASGRSFFILGGQQESLIRFYGYFCLMGVGGLLLSAIAENILSRAQSDLTELSSPRVRQLRIMLALGAGALGLSLSIAAATITQDQFNKTEKLELQQHQLSVENSLRLHMDQALMPLYAVKTLFTAQADVSRDYFHAMTHPWLERSPALQALEWIPLIRREDRAFYETLAREEGLRDFEIRDLKDGGLVRAPDRERYLPVYYVTPLEGNEAALGFDLTSNPARRDAMDTALMRRDLTMTEPIRLIQDNGEIQGILVFLPVYEEGTSELLGFALGVYRLEMLLNSVFHSANLPSAYAFHLVDFNAPEVNRRLFSTQALDLSIPGGPPVANPPADHSVRSQFYLGGRSWTLILEHTKNRQDVILDWQPWAILVLGTILSGALSFYLLSLTRTEERIATLVLDRTKLLRQAQLEAEDALHQAERASQAKSEFLAHMSHELRSPLNSILGYAELILSDQEKHRLPATVRGYLKTIISSGKHLADLIGDILDLSKVEAGQLELEIAPFNLRQQLQELAGILALPAQERNNRLVLEIAPDMSSWMLGDQVRLRQILLNFLSNAIKFTKDGEIRLEVTVLENRSDRQRLRFSIIDSGIGIAPEKIDSLFDAFTQADMSTTREFGGTGLGLAINKSLVAAMKGRLDVLSAPGQGSEFWFELELEKADSALHGEEGYLPETVRPLRLLVAEDIEINRVMTKKRLENAGHQVDTANDGAQALEMVRAHDYDAALMDIHMPNMDGVEATKQIRMLEDKVKRQLPIVALTADIASSKVRDYIAQGMDDCCAKPLVMDNLNRILVRLGLGAPPEGQAGAIGPHEPSEEAAAASESDGPILVDAQKFHTVQAALPDCMSMFRSQTEGFTERLRYLAGAGDTGELRRQAHAVKGVALTLGLEALAARCSAVEAMDKADILDSGVMATEVDRIEQLLHQTLQTLERMEDGQADPH